MNTPRHAIDWRFLGGAAALVLAFIGGHLLALTVTAGGFERAAASDAAFVVESLVALAAIIQAGRRSALRSPQLGRAWVLLAMAALMTALGEITWLIIEIGLRRTSASSFADVFYVLRYPFYIAFVVALPMQRFRRSERLRLLVDIVVLMAVVLLAVWSLLILPVLQQGQNGPFSDVALNLIYPVGDLALLWVLVWVSVRRLRQQARGPILLLMWALGIAVASDMAYAVTMVHGPVESGGWLDLGWTAAYAVLTVAGLWQSRLVRSGQPDVEDEAAEAGEAPASSLYLSYFWLAVCFLMTIVTDNQPHLEVINYTARSVTGLLVLLVSFRQVLALRENKRLYQALERAHGLLEERVQWRTAELAAANKELEAEIAERRRVDARLRQLSRAVEQSPTSILITDTRGNIEYVNPTFTRLTGYAPEEVIGQNPRILKSGATSAEEYQRLWATISAGGEWRGVLKNRKQDGGAYWGATSISPITDETGRITHYLDVNEDITERKRADEALRASESKLRHLLELSYDGILLTDEHGLVVEWNRGQEHTTGRLASEVCGQPVWDVLVDCAPPEQRRPALRAFLRRTLTDCLAGQGDRWLGTPLESEVLRPDGEIRIVKAATFAIPTEAGYIIGVASRDITERKRAEAAEREQRSLAEALRDTAAALNSTLNLDELLDQVLDNIGRVVPHDGANIVLADHRAGVRRFRTVRSRGLPITLDADWPSHWQLPLAPATWIGQVIAGGQPLIMDDVQAAAPAEAQADLAGVRAYLGVPISAKGQAIGLLNLTSARPGFFTEVHGQRLAAFAAQAAVAIENARLYEWVQQQAAEIGALYRASAKLLDTGGDVTMLAQQIASAVTREFGQANCGVLLLNEAETELTCVAWAGDYPAAATRHLPIIGPSLKAAAFRSGERIYAPDVDQDPRYVRHDDRVRSQLVVPLDTGWHILGLLDLQSSELDAFDERVQRIVTAFAGHAAPALDSARLLVRLEEAVRRANHLAGAAQEASRLKSEFLANTSHELRTPLTGIIGSLSLVLEGLCETPAEERQFVDTAYASAKHLLNVINDILDIAKIEAGRMDVTPQAVDIGALLDEVRLMLAPHAAAKRLALVVQAPPEPGRTVHADPNRLRQILLNLVGNAVKFTDQGGVTVQATFDADNQQMHIDVQDTGIGISADQQDRLFEPFVQLDGGLTRRFGGTGLGLSIARHLAELMSGSLVLHRAGEGRGTTFRLTLPLGADLAPVAVVEEPALAAD